MLSINSPQDVAQMLADRLRERRLEHGWGREELAHRSGVSAASIKRFELQADIGLSKLLALCMVLRALDDFDQVLKSQPAKSIKEIEQRLRPKRQRGRRKKS